MARIEAYLDYPLPDYEEAAYLLAKYFIGHNFEADVRKSKDYPGGYATLVRRHGLFKNLLGSRTAVYVTFYPSDPPAPEEKGSQKDELPAPDGEILIEDGEQSDIAVAVQSASQEEGQLVVQSTRALSEVKDGGKKPDAVIGGRGTMVEIHSGVVQDGVFKEVLTYVLILPAIRKLYDYSQMFNMAKVRSVQICEKLLAESKNRAATASEPEVAEGKGKKKKAKTKVADKPKKGGKA